MIRLKATPLERELKTIIVIKTQNETAGPGAKVAQPGVIKFSIVDKSASFSVKPHDNRLVLCQDTKDENVHCSRLTLLVVRFSFNSVNMHRETQ